MNYSKLLVAIFLFTCMSCVISNSKNPTKESLLEAITKFNDAFSKGHAETLVTMISNDYRHTNANTKAIDARSWVNYLHKRSKDLQSKNLVVHSYDMDQIEVVLYGTSAVVTGRVKTSSTYKGNKNENEFRVTHFWVYENERWKRAAFHDGKIK